MEENRKQVWEVGKRAVRKVKSFYAYGLNSFLLLLFKNQSDSSLVYVIGIATLLYIGVTAIENKTLSDEPDKLERISKKTQLIFRWCYVGIYLGIIFSTINQLNKMGESTFQSWKLDFQIIMCLYIALTIPRDMLWRKLKPYLKETIKSCCSYLVHKWKLK